MGKYFVRISCASISTIRPRKGQCYVLETYKSRINVTSMILIPSFWNSVLLDCYRNKMDAKDKEFYDIVFNNCTEEEIYAILLKKKEIDDKIPKLRTEDENKMLKCLVNKMRKFPKDLIAEIKNKCPFLQRKPKTAEQRKEQIRIIQHEKRSAEREIDREMGLKKQKEYETEKRSAENEIERQTRLNKQKEYNEKRVAESEIVCNLCNSSNHLCRKCKNTVCNCCGEQDPSSDNEMHIMHKKNDTRCKVGESQIGRQRRLNKQKEYDNAKRSAESKEEKEKRLNKQKEYDNEKRCAESERDKGKRLNKQKEYEYEKRSAESQEDKEKRLNKQKEYDNAKCSAESKEDKEKRLNKQKKCNKITYRQPTKYWEQELIPM